MDIIRRDILKITAAAFPLVALGESASGVAGAFADVDVYHKKIAFENLPPSLHGLRLLHLSDIHLGHYVKLDTLALVLEDARIHKPDLILVTGDIADNLRMLPGALDMIDRFGAPLGAMACLGNHEYFRGIETVHRIFADSPIPLLVDDCVRIKIDQTELTVAGIDDPRSMGSKREGFFRRTIDAALSAFPEREFTILMSHRPDALDHASETGIDLILAGHTHGGQIGLGGQSVFERVWPDRYLWGDYKKGGSHLYTSCGVGHWFPFRLGCPTEAPVIELIKGDISS